MAISAPPAKTVAGVLWRAAGLNCDGDFVAPANASQPAIEDPRDAGDGRRTETLHAQLAPFG